MQAPLILRPLTANERQALLAGLRSSHTFTMRRCQILLASAQGQHTPAIARHLHCDDQTVRNAIHAFHRSGVAALQPKSCRPLTTHRAFDELGRERLRAQVASEPAYAWQADQPLDPRVGRPGQFCPGSDRPSSQQRNHSFHVAGVGGALEASKTRRSRALIRTISGKSTAATVCCG
jgi:hypothetical protein